METRHRKRRLITESVLVSDPSSDMKPSVRQPSIIPSPLGSQNQSNFPRNDMAGKRSNKYVTEVF